ncbi:MAG TPA: class I tRNA ligase family protein, partial [Candidatus Limnocylindrales bacterium]|nr:class I tRNA ligase family protein [Candidatus Limnocylindrales bacterium]
WNDLCDWYVEIAKLGLAANATPERRVTTWRTLTWVLDRLLRLLHPVVPHVTEAIWERLPHLATDPELLIVARWPDATGLGADAGQAYGVGALIELVTALRAARAESGIEAADWLPAAIWLGDDRARAAYPALAPAIGRLARVQPTLVERREDLDATAGGLAVVSGAAEARLTRSDADRERERARLVKELRNVEAQLSATSARLEDAGFTGRAPAAVVEQTRRRAAELTDQAQALQSRLKGD